MAWLNSTETPSKFALVAEIEEKQTADVDLRMQSLGGVIFRRDLSDVKRTAGKGQHKCAHFECKCMLGADRKYCSDYCSDAAEEKETELQCDCKHPPCALD